MPVTEYQVYSEQETVVGVWTDERPIYRKVFGGDNTKLAFPFQTGISGGDHLVLLKCIGSDGENNTSYKWEINIAGTKTNGSIYCNDTLTTVYRNGSFPVNTVIIEYTKTTDTPTTKKVPFEPLIEYSTDEKMIGYWVDGKPLYRRVFKFDTFYSKGSNTLIANFKSSFNIDNVSRFYGTATSNNGSIYNLTGIGQDGKSGVEIETNGALMFYVSNSTGVTWKPCVTIEYTKTTD